MSKMLLEDLKPGHDDDKEIYTKAYIPEERKAHTASTSVVKRKRRKKSSWSVSGKEVYRNEDSRHFSYQQKNPIYIASILNGEGNSKFIEESRNCGKPEDSKFSSPTKPGAVELPKAIQRSPSEAHERNLNNIFTHAPHGGALERLNNEERLNFLSDANLSKIDTNSAKRRNEKSVDLDFRSGAMMDRNTTDFITNRIINNNQLSKYLTKFIGNKDYRTTEERELDKCTFKPKFVNKKKFKNVRGKVSGCIREKNLNSRQRNIALFSASENIKGFVQSSLSVGRGLSADGRFNNSMWMSDGGFLFRTEEDETSTISVLNEMRSIPTIYSNKNLSGLGGILQFGYSHKYHERKHLKDIINPTIKSLNQANSTFLGSCGKGISLNITEGDNSSVFQSKILTPIKSSHGLRTHRLFTNNLATKAEQIKRSPMKFQEQESTNFTPEQLEKIKKIHEVHFKLKR